MDSQPAEADDYNFGYREVLIYETVFFEVFPTYKICLKKFIFLLLIKLQALKLRKISVCKSQISNAIFFIDNITTIYETQAKRDFKWA